MRSLKSTITGTICLGASVALAGACGSDTEEGDATLEIVGDDAKALDHGDTADLAVRYLEDGEALEGDVEFAIEGEAHGAELIDNVVSTDATGEASTTLNADNEEEASFEVVASAADAADASWNISISEPLGPGDPDGTYRVESEFDLVPGLEGDVGSVIQAVVNFADEPGEAILEVMIPLADSIPGVDAESIDPEVWGGVLTDALDDYAPDFLSDILEIGNHFSQVSQEFVLITELEVSGGGASHTVTGVEFRIDGHAEEYSMNEMGVDEVEASDVDFSLDENDGTVELAVHDLPTGYGEMLLFGLEDFILPQIEEGFVGDLDDFLSDALEGECDNIADFVEDELGSETAGDIVAEACDFGMGALFAQIRTQIRDFGDDEEDIVFSLEGEGVAQDELGDGNTDVIVGGTWEADLEVGGNTVTVITQDESSFEAERE